MIRFVARWDQGLTCRSKKIRQGERTLREDRLLWHDSKGLIVLGPISAPPCFHQTAIKVPPQCLDLCRQLVQIFRIPACK